MTDEGDRPSTGSVEAIRRMCAAVAADDLLAEHETLYDEVLPHVMIADLRALFVRLSDERDERALTRFADALEEVAASPDAGARNAAEISFVEDMLLGDSHEQASVPTLRRLAGPATGALLVEVAARLERQRGAAAMDSAEIEAAGVTYDEASEIARKAFHAAAKAEFTRLVSLIPDPIDQTNASNVRDLTALARQAAKDEFDSSSSHHWALRLSRDPALRHRIATGE
jgi:hypothetical protein